jgi:prepilin-type processing-associated H-X9-DG protein
VKFYFHNYWTLEFGRHLNEKANILFADWHVGPASRDETPEVFFTGAGHDPMP